MKRVAKATTCLIIAFWFLVFISHVHGKGIHRLEMQVTNLSFGKEQGKEEALHGFNDMCNFLSLISPLFSLSFFHYFLLLYVYFS
jgi:hypothetical protein